MIMGYPGRTNRYEVSYGIDIAINESNPAVVDIRTERLAIMKKHMDADKSVYLQLTSRYASIANYWKYFIGQTAVSYTHLDVYKRQFHCCLLLRCRFSIGANEQGFVQVGK